MLKSLHRTSLLAAVAVMFLSVLSAITAQAAQPGAEKLSLWSGQAPVGDGQFEATSASLTTHLAPAKPNGAAVVICPGGGYGGLVVGPEGHGIAKWLNDHGIGAGCEGDLHSTILMRLLHALTRRAPHNAAARHPPVRQSLPSPTRSCARWGTL